MNIDLDGERQISNKVINVSPATTVPSDLQTKHLWPSGLTHPSFESVGGSCVNVKALAVPAQGDGATDDYEVIQGALDAHACVYLPRGLYLTSRTLQVHAGRALIGVAKHLTRITSLDVGLTAPPRHPNHLRVSDTAVLPVVEVLPTTATTSQQTAGGNHTFIFALSVSVWNTLNSTSALHFHADDGIYRQFHANRANRCGGQFFSLLFFIIFHCFSLCVHHFLLSFEQASTAPAATTPCASTTLSRVSTHAICLCLMS